MSTWLPKCASSRHASVVFNCFDTTLESLLDACFVNHVGIIWSWLKQLIITFTCRSFRNQNIWMPNLNTLLDSRFANHVLIIWRWWLILIISRRCQHDWRNACRVLYQNNWIPQSNFLLDACFANHTGIILVTTDAVLISTYAKTLECHTRIFSTTTTTPTLLDLRFVTHVGIIWWWPLILIISRWCQHDWWNARPVEYTRVVPKHLNTSWYIFVTLHFILCNSPCKMRRKSQSSKNIATRP